MKKNVKKIGQFSGTIILRKVEMISFNFDMWSSVAICKAENHINFVEISFGGTEGWFRQPYDTNK